MANTTDTPTPEASFSSTGLAGGDLLAALRQIADAQPCEVMQQDSTMRVDKFQAYLAGSTVNVAREAIQRASWQTSLPPEELLIPATRYYIGRRTIHAGWYAEHLAAAWPKLPESTRRILRRDLEDEFRRDDYARLHEATDGKTYGVLPLGDDCDRACWEKVRLAWRHEDVMATKTEPANDKTVPPSGRDE